MWLDKIRLSFLIWLSGFLLVLTIFLLIVNPEGYIKLLEILLSPDKKIDHPIRAIITIQFFFAFVFLTLLLFKTRLNVYLSKYPKVSPINKIMHMLVGICLFLFAIQLIFKTNIFHVEDAFLESFTAITAIFASIILLISIKEENEFICILIKILLSAVFLFIGMEEISWGQRIFNLKTPELLIDKNYQNEINIHNFLNPYFHFLYPVFNLILSVVILNTNRLRILLVSSKFKKLIHLIPDSNFHFFGFVFLILCPLSLFPIAWEPIEEIFSIFLLSYSLYQLDFTMVNRSTCQRK